MKTWGDVFNHYLARGHDHASAAYAADQWEARMNDEEDPYRYFDGVKFKCKRCGRQLNGEVALVDGEEWCHPCADENHERLYRRDAGNLDYGETHVRYSDRN